jgi:hypothetical protein
VLNATRSNPFPAPLHLLNVVAASDQGLSLSETARAASPPFPPLTGC